MKKLTVLLLLLVVLAAQAELPRLIPLETLFGQPNRFAPRLSPDGTQMTYIAPHEGVLNIWLKTIGEDDDHPVTFDEGQGIYSHYWVKNGDYLLYKQDSNGDENHHIFRVELATGEVTDLTPFPGVKCSIYTPEFDYPDSVILRTNQKNPEIFDYYILNIVSGEITMLEENPGNAAYFDFDSNRQARAMGTFNELGGRDVYVRETVEDEWELLVSWDFENSGSFSLAFNAAGDELYLVDTRNSDTGQLTSYNLETGVTTVIAEDPDYELADSGYEFSPVTNELDLIAFYRQTQDWVALDEDLVDDIAFLDEQFVEYGFSDRSADDRVWLLTAYSDVKSGSTWAYNRDDKSLEKLFDIRPEVNEYALASMIPISYEARDGLEIEGYLTLPVGVYPRNLPLVLNVHGGPGARDFWGYSGQVQLLANRGYAVLQVDYRGSTGYGKAHCHAGDKEWGGKMQDDLTDAVLWAVEEGIADPDRLCIYGWSYGGYAALAGSTFTPDLFACAFSGIGPADLASFLDTIPTYWKPYLEHMYLSVGHPVEDEELLFSRSPVNFVDRISIPMLLVYGRNDARVNIAQGDIISAALDESGIPYEMVIYEDEGHGLGRPENRLDASRRLDKFLAEHLGGRWDEHGVTEE